jgi:PAS domain S-box-containing protein
MRPEDLGIGKLFERVRDAVMVADAATQQIVLWNRAATETFGYPLSGALEMRVEALISEHLQEPGGTFEVLSRPGTLIVARVPFKGFGEDVKSG